MSLEPVYFYCPPTYGWLLPSHSPFLVSTMLDLDKDLTHLDSGSFLCLTVRVCASVQSRPGPAAAQSVRGMIWLVLRELHLPSPQSVVTSSIRLTRKELVAALHFLVSQGICVENGLCRCF